MAKYIFNKDYETQVRISDNGTSKGTKQVKILKGTSIEGQLVEGSELISLVYNGNKLSVDKSNLDNSDNSKIIKKYQFTQPFQTTISVGGVVGRSPYNKKVGDIIEGYIIPPKDNALGSQSMVRVILNKTQIQVQGAQNSLDIPISYLKEYDEFLPKSSSFKPFKKVSTSIFTTKNIVITAIVVGGVIFFLKHKNII
jgi:hypothetical protein